MTRSERRLIIDTTVLGLLLTALVLAISQTGMLTPAEQYSYDFRAKAFQYFTPPPTDKLVHVDIDDRSLEVIGRWPWSRSVMAEIVDEISLAGAKAMAMDIIFSEPQPAGYEEIAPATRPSTQPADQPVLVRRIDHDAIFAGSLRRFGKAIIPLSLNLSLAQPKDSVFRAITGELVAHLNLPADEVHDRLRARGRMEGDLRAEVNTHFLNARREAMFERISAEMRAGDFTLEQLRARILPDLPEIVTGHPLLRILQEQHQRYGAVRALRRFARTRSADLPLLLNTHDEQATLEPFAEAAYSTGYVDYVPLGDGTVRSVPLFAIHRDYVFPQMGLSLACAMLDVPLRQVKMESDRVLLPRPDGTQTVIPVHSLNTPRGRAGMFMDIPWFGRAGASTWETMYDYPEQKRPKQHMPIQFIWEAAQFKHRIVRNNENAADALALLINKLADELKADWAKYRPGDMADPNAYTPMIDRLMKVLGEWGYDKDFEKKTAADYKHEEDRRLWLACKAVKQVRTQNPGLKQDQEKRRAELREQLNGRAVLIGYIAVGAIADVVPTSLHPRCPGVVVHGVIFNSIMNGDFWRVTPPWVTLLITGALGLLTTAIVAWLSPWKALTASFALAGAYFIFNGVYLFDYQNLLVGLATPLTAVGTVWAGGTLTRYILEASERRKVERSFRNYVDKALVDYVLENENADLSGQVREVTVVFTDLEGFTKIAEQLQEGAVKILNEYMTLMTPLIGQHHGLFNKMLGDGMMFFYSAPKDNPEHALDALKTVLDMKRKEGPFNQSLIARGLPALKTRVGIGSGFMIVGNCGTTDGAFNDYTVLGDSVNLTSRLEGANKAFGSAILVNIRAHQLLGDRVLFRPIGNIQVKGKKEGVMAYEPLALIEEATDEQKRLAELTSAVVTSFMDGQFAASLEAVAKMEGALGESKLTHLYRDLCTQYLQEPPETFNGQVVLTEK